MTGHYPPSVGETADGAVGTELVRRLVLSSRLGGWRPLSGVLAPGWSAVRPGRTTGRDGQLIWGWCIRGRGGRKPGRGAMAGSGRAGEVPPAAGKVPEKPAAGSARVPVPRGLALRVDADQCAARQLRL